MTDVEKMSFEFALKIVKSFGVFKKHVDIALARQLLRSGTSIGANVHEAQAGQSRADFISKMAIASKEARETEYWLKLFDQAGFLASIPDGSVLLSDSRSLVNILTKIVKTTQKKEVKSNVGC